MLWVVRSGKRSRNKTKFNISEPSWSVHVLILFRHQKFRLFTVVNAVNFLWICDRYQYKKHVAV